MKILKAAQEKIMNKKIIKQIVLVVIVLLAGFVFFKILASMRKAPAKKEQQSVAPLLNAIVVNTESIQVVIPGFGTVQPKVEVTIIPQVSGKIIECHDDFVNGGLFNAGEALIVIEPDDYELAVESADAAVKQAQVAYEKELAEQKVALQEWEQIHPDQKPDSPLVTRDLQVKFAEAQLKASQAKLSTAKLALERTKITLPFSGIVADESVDLGQYIPAGQPIATVYSTEAVEIVIPLADTQLQWFDVPGGNNSKSDADALSGAKVEIIAEFSGGKHSWAARVVRCQGQIDSVSRMVHVVVEVEDPFKLTNSRPALMPGMFVEVDIQGRKIEKIIRVPRYAIRDGNQVWIEVEKELQTDGDAKIKRALEISEVVIARLDRKYAYITNGLNDGDVVIVSPLDVVTDGMAIRTNVLNSN